MARGWESKAVADQIDQADERDKEENLAAEDSNSPAVKARREHLEALRLSHTRTLDQLDCATNPAHREMLKRALRFLETQMTDVS